MRLASLIQSGHMKLLHWHLVTGLHFPKTSHNDLLSSNSITSRFSWRCSCFSWLTEKLLISTATVFTSRPLWMLLFGMYQEALTIVWGILFSHTCIILILLSFAELQSWTPFTNTGLNSSDNTNLIISSQFDIYYFSFYFYTLLQVSIENNVQYYTQYFAVFI